ncbi:PepSY-associated TM helix domain-containing protein [Kangiella aquimarina]|uniref:PepSY-associated TM helix domain-containing protein n=1 Tax=Kangiella aquimarina TaxID=261965 RepID=A0ABZ0X7D1_9GAMM|nr:PepSY-associated TM helix domain-containing protein [Kangiella aquimarina]WQG86440.1 PepSY-associated TM helix domain-containing protein [Kangiella aquimarina]
MSRKKQAAPKSTSRYKLHFRKWHRRLGFLAAIFLLNLSITGLLLNHYQSLSLHKNYITSTLLLDWYGIKAPDSGVCLSKEPLSVCQIGEQHYINGQYWKETSSQLLLLEPSPIGLVLVTNEFVYWLTKTGQLIDALSIADSLDTAATSATQVNQQIYIQTLKGNYQLNENTFQWEPVDIINFPQLTKEQLDGDQLSDLQEQYRSRQITQLKLVQDLHSGAIFGITGTLFTDIMALILIWLVISGFVTWYRRRSKTST